MLVLRLLLNIYIHTYHIDMLCSICLPYQHYFFLSKKNLGFIVNRHINFHILSCTNGSTEPEQTHI